MIERQDGYHGKGFFVFSAPLVRGCFALRSAVDLAHMLESRSLKKIKRIFDDNGMVPIELEFITDGFVDDERKNKSGRTKQMLSEAAGLKPQVDRTASAINTAKGFL